MDKLTAYMTAKRYNLLNHSAYNTIEGNYSALKENHNNEGIKPGTTGTFLGKEIQIVGKSQLPKGVELMLVNDEFEGLPNG